VHELIGIKITTWIIAAIGGFVYAIQVGHRTIGGRLVGWTTGCLTAVFVGPGIVEYYNFDLGVASGVIFITGGFSGAAWVTILGIVKDPYGFAAKLRKIKRGK